MKEEYARGLMLYLPIATLERKLSCYAAWYNRERPHEGLGLQTPEDIFRVRPVRQRPRAEAGKLEVRLLDGDRRLPIFRLRPSA